MSRSREATEQVAEYLLGTASSVVDACHTLELDEALIEGDILDESVFECEQCGWWCSMDEAHDASCGWVCDDCNGETEDD